MKDLKDLAETILSEPLVQRVFDTDIEAFLVGGYLRDIIRGVRSKDIDFVIRGDMKNAVAKIFPGEEKSVIEFKNNLLLRVVVGDTVVDFTELKENLEDDLNRRDFTMNAIAWSLDEGIIDPLQGIRDIEKSRIRGISEKNFVDDPLRLLRTYRFSAELGWKIDEGTRTIVRKLKDLIRLSATERITLEAFKLLSSNAYLQALKTAIADGLLQDILSIDNNQLLNNIKVLSMLNSFLKKIPEGFERSFFEETFSQGLTYIGLVRAEQLLCGSDFQRNNLKMSRAIHKRVEVISRLLKDYEKNRNPNDSKIFDFFTEAKDAVMDFALSTRKRRLVKKAELFMNLRPILPAEKVMEMIGLGSGPDLGSLIKEMRRLQFLGRIKSEKDASAWLSGMKGRSRPKVS